MGLPLLKKRVLWMKHQLRKEKEIIMAQRAVIKGKVRGVKAVALKVKTVNKVTRATATATARGRARASMYK